MKTVNNKIAIITCDGGITEQKEDILREAEALCKALDTLKKLRAGCIDLIRLELLFPTLVKKLGHGEEAEYYFLNDEEQRTIDMFKISEPGTYIRMNDLSPDHDIVIRGNFHCRENGPLDSQEYFRTQKKDFYPGSCSAGFRAAYPIGFRTRTSAVKYLIKAGADTYLAVTANTVYLLHGLIDRTIYMNCHYHIRDCERKFQILE